LLLFREEGGGSDAVLGLGFRRNGIEPSTQSLDIGVSLLDTLLELGDLTLQAIALTQQRGLGGRLLFCLGQQAAALLLPSRADELKVVRLAAGLVELPSKGLLCVE
jgi:hypothetical protein